MATITELQVPVQVKPLKLEKYPLKTNYFLSPDEQLETCQISLWRFSEWDNIRCLRNLMEINIQPPPVVTSTTGSLPVVQFLTLALIGDTLVAKKIGYLSSYPDPPGLLLYMKCRSDELNTTDIRSSYNSSLCARVVVLVILLLLLPHCQIPSSQPFD